MFITIIYCYLCTMEDKKAKEEKYLFPEILIGHDDTGVMHLGTCVRYKRKNKYYTSNIRLQRTHTHTKEDAIEFMKTFMKEVYFQMMCVNPSESTKKIQCCTLDEDQTSEIERLQKYFSFDTEDITK